MEKEVCHVCNVKVKCIRPSYNDLREWMLNPNNVYIGRKGVLILDGNRFPENNSLWANPFKIDKTKDAETERNRVLEAYHHYIIQKIEKENLFTELEKLRGKNLGCWCAPQKCHGDILKHLLSLKPNWNT